MANQYRISIEEIHTKGNAQTLSFEIEDRENILEKIELINKSISLENNQATRVMLGLRLLAPVLMENRKNGLFNEFFPHFKRFMQHLKSTVKNNQNLFQTKK